MLKKLQLNFSTLFGLSLLVLSVVAIANELHEYNYRDILNSLAAIPKSRLSWAIWLTALGYLVMIGYDILGFSYINRSLNWNKIALTNFISSAFSNTIGFALLTGSAIRYRFYASWGVSAVAIAQVIAFANFTFWLGMFAVAGCLFLINPLKIPTQLHLPFSTVRPIGVIFLLLVAGYLLGSIFIKQPLIIHGEEFRFPDFKISLIQIAISSLDWILAAAVLYAVLPSNISLSYLDFLGIYLLAMFAGVVSNVPGGLGVFETIILLILSSKVSAAAILGSMLAYRGIYYFLPLLVASGLLGLYEIRFGKLKNINKF
ncbi:MAG: lysylphosphatidylglycerol synthase domain-containing protein [Nostoc sp. DedVER02]|uniref:lysylphosphatidylglycerol synthase domain-containing protein n=1 Tax=unclassified Nostoc TaxID=2593658 RepID=UPI002AD58833|nr:MULTISPECIES: lysylphosphatidylglycerol synthase domain-containing protein [unclassified Nostoc]MDZ7989468.1 lysylphosphatidylglycerol synthase domain-containing protein [Nostoc sp. DedVER02]MDZ8114565.1 lysylphosphatidylglycerol synthase domain-containing protein [Nostoc sp. DedVER01b]